jgi:hypothetical protein
MIRYKLDPSTTSVLGLCREPGCGFRALASSSDEARHVRDEHEAAMHMVRGRHARRRTMRTF